MHSRQRTLLIFGSAAVMAVGLMATAAFAATGAHHGAGSARTSSTATWSVAASFDTETSVTWALTDTATGTKITCGVEPNYVFTQAMGLHGHLASVTAILFNGCSLPGGTAISLTGEHLPWAMVGRRFDPSRNLGVTSGVFSGIDISLSATGCSGVLDGTAAGADNGTSAYQYYNLPGFLFERARGNLHVYNVSGCTGLFNEGDAFTITNLQKLGGPLVTSP